jgi:hypothetical protein
LAFCSLNRTFAGEKKNVKTFEHETTATMPVFGFVPICFRFGTATPTN